MNVILDSKWEETFKSIWAFSFNRIRERKKKKPKNKKCTVTQITRLLSHHTQHRPRKSCFLLLVICSPLPDALNFKCWTYTDLIHLVSVPFLMSTPTLKKIKMYLFWKTVRWEVLWELCLELVLAPHSSCSLGNWVVDNPSFTGLFSAAVNLAINPSRGVQSIWVSLLITC